MEEDRALRGLLEQRKYRVVGESITRPDSASKVLGKERYTADYRLENLVYCKAVRSQHPHALIRSIDVTETLRHRGVIGVVTAADIAGVNEVGFFLPDEPVLAHERVRHMGDVVALVVGVTPEDAKEGCEHVQVNYEPLAAVFSPLEAMKPDAPKLHDRGNILESFKVRRGDVEKGFAQADVVVEGEYQVPWQEHAYLETEAALAVPEGDQLTVIGSMQCPFEVKKAVEKVLGPSVRGVRIVQAATGGGFGGKEDAPNAVCARAALAAVKFRRPTLLAYTREESIAEHPKRHPAIIRRKVGAAKDGRLLAVETFIVTDAGAYAGLSPRVIFQMVTHATGPYVVENVKTDGVAVYTNNVPSSAFRGFGKPQVQFAAELQMDELAARLGMDPLELRLRNILTAGAETATGQLLDHSVGLRETLLKAAEASRWSEKRHAYGRQGGPKRWGIGLACIYHGTSIGPLGRDVGAAEVTLHSDGAVTVKTGLTEYGQGIYTGFTQIVSEVLGVPVDAVEINYPDTSDTLDSGPTVASRSTVMGGMAVLKAARKIRERLNAAAAEMLGCEAEEIEIEEGRVFVRSRPTEFVSLSEVASRCIAEGVSLSEREFHKDTYTWWDREAGEGAPWMSYSFATHVAEVEVDVETGQVWVLRYVAAHDVGKAINPQLVKEQIFGGVVQGLGYALFEEVVSEEGRILTTNFLDYHIPTCYETPEIVPILVEEAFRDGPFGAKGIGEPPIEPVAGAVANAVFHAVGVPIRRIPLTPERVYGALGSRKI